MKGSDIFIKALEQEGVEYIFGVPGEENLDFIESLRTSSVKLIVTRHEQPAGFMAATYGRLTGKAGVCLSTLGPGATNLMIAAEDSELNLFAIHDVYRPRASKETLSKTADMIRAPKRPLLLIGAGARIARVIAILFATKRCSCYHSACRLFAK